jgi:hypothetical protein
VTDGLDSFLREIDDTYGDAHHGEPVQPRRSRKKDDPRLFRKILINGELPRMTTQAWNALTAFNNPPSLFTVADHPARIKQSRSGAASVEDLNVDSMTRYCSRSAYWYKLNTGGQMGPMEVEQPPPQVVMRDMLTDPEPPLPNLKRITRAPMFGRKGQLETQPGYQPSTEHYFHASGFDLPPIPEHPTQAEAQTAAEWIFDELFVDFPFSGPHNGLAEIAHAYSCLINPFVRDLIDGPTPMYLIEAPSPGAGKGLLAHTLTYPALGAPPVLMPDASNEEELRKRLMGSLMALPEALVLDNIATSLDSPSLASALTAREFTDRVLGRSEIRTIPVTCTWLATGNNPSKSGEMARRTIRIRLDPGVERPEERTVFRHADLEQWIHEHRAEIVGKVLTMVRGWVAAGMQPGKQTLGSYGSWARVHSGILEFLAIPGFLQNRSEDRLLTVSEDAAWTAFVATWWETYSTRPVNVAELYDIAREVDGFNLGRALDARGQRNALGQQLSRNREKIYDGKAVLFAGKPKNVSHYKLRDTEELPDF